VVQPAAACINLHVSRRRLSRTWSIEFPILFDMHMDICECRAQLRCSTRPLGLAPASCANPRPHMLGKSSLPMNQPLGSNPPLLSSRAPALSPLHPEWVDTWLSFRHHHTA
jgi:hypothetical protein